MLNYLACKIWEELKGKYFSDPREAYEYIKSLSQSEALDISNYIVTPIELEWLQE